jgi:hypothetical protein
MAQGIVIRNSQEQLAVDTMKKAHTLLCEKLGVKTDLTFQRKCNWGKDAKHAGWYRSSEKLVALNFRNMYGATVGDLLEVLGHEMRHAVQDVKGWHKLRGYKKGGMFGTLYGTWKGQTMYIEYSKAPWEIDARKHEKPYAKIAIDALGLTKEVLETQIPFGTKTESNRNATYNKILKRLKVSNQDTFELLHVSWFKSKKLSTSDGMLYIQKRNMLKNFDFKNPKHTEWLRNYGQQWIRFMPMVKVTSQYGGFSVREMVS